MDPSFRGDDEWAAMTTRGEDEEFIP
jgi:hypothetical protein